MKCPYCGSKNTQGTNIGARVFATTASIGVGLLARFAGPTTSTTARIVTDRALCEYSKYICLDCKHEFQEKR